MNRIFAGAVATIATHIDGIIENLGNLHTIFSHLWSNFSRLGREGVGFEETNEVVTSFLAFTTTLRR